MAQIIDEDANIAEGLSDYLKSIGITKSGVDYHIISIIGAQSSGKSTLLNHLFHTKFATMNETTGRQQTTKGIHAAYGKDSKILVFDIEGSDSRERGDSDSLFERKAALFALALSEVVMVNMWQNDIGRYNASSIPLLKTVFEVNLQLFSSESKCHLLFVIRDSTTDEKIIEGQVKRDLELIWSQLQLPSNLAGRPFEDFFIFHFFALPHFRLKKPEFDVAVGKLTDEFINPNDDCYLFKEPTGKIIPGDGLYKYICGVWDAISQNKELNLPSQRRTLSNFRCEEFVKKALIGFNDDATKHLAAKMEDNKVVSDFSEICKKLIDNALEYYNNNSKQYVPDIVEEKRNQLISKMGEILYPYYTQNCRNCLITNEQEFADYIENQLPSNLMESEKWEQKALHKLKQCVDSLQKHITNDVIMNFEWEFDSNNFEDVLHARLNSRLEEMIRQLEEKIFNDAANPYKESIDKDLAEAEPNMWEILRKKMNDAINQTSKEINAIIKKNCTDDKKCSSRIQERFHRATTSRVLIASRYVAQKMNMKFDEKFRQDENGKTRIWNPDDDVSSIFEDARQRGINVLRMFSACQLREPGDKIPPNDILTQQMINPITAQGLEDKFNDQIEKVYVDAVRIKESKRIRVNIPRWMMVLFAYFGYPKIIFLLKHPSSIIFIIAAGAIFYLLYRFGYIAIAYDFLIKKTSKGASKLINILQGDNKKGKRKHRSIRHAKDDKLIIPPKPASSIPTRSNSIQLPSAPKPPPSKAVPPSIISDKPPTIPKRKRSIKGNPNKNMTLRPASRHLIDNS